MDNQIKTQNTLPTPAPRRLWRSSMDLPLTNGKYYDPDMAYDRLVDRTEKWYHASPDHGHLMKSGDIESNPGPAIYSTPLSACDNCYSADVEASIEAWAQLRASLNDNAPPPRCFRCGEPLCYCKCAHQNSTQTDCITALIKMVTSILDLVRSANTPRAQLFGFNQATGAVGDLADTVRDAVTASREEIGNMRDSVAEMVAAIPKAINQILDSRCGLLPVSIRTVLYVALTLIGVYIFVRTIGWSYVLIEQILEACSVVLQVPLDIITQFRLWIAADQPCAQLGEDTNSFVSTWIPTLVPMLFSMVGIGALRCVPAHRMTPDVWSKRVADLPRTVKSIGEIYSFCKKWVMAGLEWVEMSFFNTSFFKSQETYTEIENWLLEVEAASKNIKEVCSTTAGTERVSSMWIRGTQLLRRYQNLMSRDHVDAFKRMLTLASKLAEIARTNFARGGGIRTVPLMIWLTGESQIGKSSMTYYLIAEVLARFGLAGQIKDHTYARHVGQEFWDGYNGQFVCIHDDYGQVRDTANAPNPEHGSLIGEVNPFDFPLHMADLSQKANSFFTSKFIICSSNNRAMEINSLTYPEAVWNRFYSGYDVRIKPEYSERVMVEGQMRVTLNKRLAQEHAPVVNGKKQPINLDVYEIYPFDPKRRTERINSNPLSFAEFANLIADEMVRKAERGNDIMAAITDYVTALEKGDAETVAALKSSIPLAQNGGEFVDAQPNPQAFKISAVLEFLEKEYRKEDGTVNVDYLVAMNELKYAASTNPHAQYAEELNADYFSSDFQAIYKAMAETSWWNDIQYKVTLWWNNHKTIWEMAKVGMVAFCDRIISPIWQEVSRWVMSLFSNQMALYAGVFALSGVLGWFVSQKTIARGTGESHNPTTQPKHLGKKSFDKIIPGFKKTESHNPHTQPKHVKARQFGTRPKFVKSELAPASEGIEPENVHPESEMAIDQQQLDVMQMAVRQQYLVSCQKDGIWGVPLGTLTFIKGSIAMMPGHFLTWIKQLKPDLIKLSNSYIEKTMELCEFTQEVVIPEKDEEDGTQADVCFLNLFGKMPPHKNLVDHFLTTSDLGVTTGKFEGSLSGLRLFDGRPTMLISCGRVTSVDRLTFHGAGATHNGIVYGQNHQVYVRNLYEYQIPTQAGYCGMLLSMTSTRLPRKLLGFHVAGSASGNWSMSITHEDLVAACELFPKKAQLNASFADRAYNIKTIPGAFLPVCKIEDGPHEVSKSTIIKSCIYGKLNTPSTKPAHLRAFTNVDGEVKDPMLIGVQKAGANLPTLNTTILRACATDVLSLLSRNMEDDLRVLTVEEACAGVPGDELRNPISSATSPGYGWDKHGLKGKSYYLGEEGFNPNAPGFEELKSACESLVEKLNNGEDVSLLALDCLKDERRPIRKVEDGKTRVFTVLPMDMNVVFRQYFMDALVHTRRNRITNGIAVGLNVWSAEWERFYQYMAQTGTQYCGDGDFSNLDGTLSDKILWEVCWIINEMYDDEHRDLREALWQRLVYCIRYFRGEAYQCTHSLPSGIFGTSDFGSMYLLIAFRYIWMTSAPVEMRNLFSFNENVRLVTYGDDNIWSVTKQAAQFWNNQFLEKGFATFGMSYTDAAKTTVYGGEMVAYKPLTECQFLKRVFKWNAYLGRHTAPCEIDGRIESLNWTRRNNMVDPNEITRDVIQDVLQEIAAHGDEKLFQEWALKIMKVTSRVGLEKVVIEPFLFYLDRETYYIVHGKM